MRIDGLTNCNCTPQICQVDTRLNQLDRFSFARLPKSLNSDISPIVSQLPRIRISNDLIALSVEFNAINTRNIIFVF